MNETDTVRVLIAEDDALLNEGIASQLTRLGYLPVGQAYDGTQAVELTCQKQPSVVLMDLQMIDPETGREDLRAGLKAAHAIQQRFPVAVIVLTAHETPELVREASAAGVSGYLVKPARDQELIRAITISLARFDDLMALRRAALEMERRNDELRIVLQGTKTMRGLLSLCAWCKKVQNEDGLWREIEVYVQEHSEATFTHGVCPECHKSLFPGNRSQFGTS
jgi:AmiR/NasT family two-component response regulator